MAKCVKCLRGARINVTGVNPKNTLKLDMGGMEENENFIHNKYGYCFYSINDTAIIYNLYVEPEYRQKGHAKKLIQMVIKEIREAGYNKEIQIEACPREDSIDVENLVVFYKKMGLKILELNSD